MPQIPRVGTRETRGWDVTVIVPYKEKQTICAILEQDVMPLKTPSSSPSKKSKSRAKAKGKSSTRGKSTSKAAPGRRKAAPQTQPELVSLNWWDTLTDERKLDVVGAIMAVAGLLTLLVLFSARRSTVSENLVSILTRTLGYGVYILPVGLILMGIWLILRRIEKLPPLTLERATGIVILFLWLLAAMHSIIAAPEMAEQAAMDGAGGGVIGSTFEKALFQ